MFIKNVIKHTQEIKYKAVKEWITPNVFFERQLES